VLPTADWGGGFGPGRLPVQYISRNSFNQAICAWRRERDSNPRKTLLPSTVFISEKGASVNSFSFLISTWPEEDEGMR